MMPPSDMKTEPLTAEERALAQRLARLGPNGEPSPALDARILGAAHDAVSKQADLRRPQRRWPVAFGIAASLALAVGIAWQLRPLPQPDAADRSEAPVAASAARAPERTATAETMAKPASAPADAAAVAPPSEAGATPAVEAGAARESMDYRKAAAAPARSPRMPSPAVAPVSEPDIVFDSPTPATDAAAQATQPATAAPRAFSPAPPPAPTTSDRRWNAAAAAEAANALPETDTLDRLQSTGNRAAAASDEPESEVPPATMTSPEARDAWLARIRELLAAGRTDAARASLREFVHRYPEEPLPDDLRALGQ